jgi:hypothetical protein
MDRELVDFLTRGQNLLQFSFFLAWVPGIWNQGGKINVPDPLTKFSKDPQILLLQNSAQCVRAE